MSGLRPGQDHVHDVGRHEGESDPVADMTLVAAGLNRDLLQRFRRAR